jgi:hypothetical protein
VFPLREPDPGKVLSKGRQTQICISVKNCWASGLTEGEEGEAQWETVRSAAWEGKMAWPGLGRADRRVGFEPLSSEEGPICDFCGASVTSVVHLEDEREASKRLPPAAPNVWIVASCLHS